MSWVRERRRRWREPSRHDWVWSLIAMVAVSVFAIASLWVALSFASMKARAVTDEAAAKRDCASDAMTYCSNEAMSGNRSAIIRCMKRNRSKLNPQCRAHFQ